MTNNNITKQGQNTKPSHFVCNNKKKRHKSKSKHKTITLCKQNQTITSQNKVKTLHHHTLWSTTNNNISKQGQNTKPSHFVCNNKQ